MKAAWIAPLVALALSAAALGSAQANQALATDKCGKCHEMDKKKKGPPYKETAAKYKGKAGAEDQLYKTINDPKGDHPEFKASEADQRAVLKWILSL
ncbi:MAG: cytochrome C [Rubrivivax sp.]|nr:cytochrome C [Rubrivivax sp.]